MELCHKLVESSMSVGAASGFVRSFAAPRSVDGKWVPGADPLSTAMFPHLIAMDRLRLQGKGIGSSEQKALEHAMFTELDRQFGRPTEGPFAPGVCAPAGGYEPMTLLHMMIGPYRRRQWANEQARKAAEAAAEAKARAEAERVRAVEELGEIRIIGRKIYIVKGGEVFEIIDHHHAHVLQHGRNPDESQRARFISQLITLTAAQIRMLRGPRAFASTNEAEEHWAAIEEAEIIAEARRRLAEEQRAAAAADAAAAREARIRAVMQNLRP
jgi:hypothetical protein